VLAPLANEKGVNYDCRVHHEVPSRLVGDPGRLRQVLLNLGACAIRHTDDGQVAMRIERIDESDTRVTLRFAVSDYRPGGTSEPLVQLYRCYGEDDIAHARSLGGAGLSLAVARQVVTRMGGTAGLDLRPGVGNTLWFQLALEKQVESAQPNLLPTIQLRGLRALVVDPSKSARDAMVEMLTAWGCRAEALDQGESALAALREGARLGDPFRVALIDMQLEGMSGEELGQAIRGEGALSATSTLLLTSLGRKGDAQRAQSLGFSAYLLKPLQWSELYEAIVEVLGRAESKSGPAAALITRHSLAESRRGRVRVLLVEDSAVNQLVAEWALRRLGYSIDAVTSAADGIQASEKNRYDLILMDVQLTDMDGCKAAAAIRARERGRHTPIVGMSGHAQDGDRARCIEAGMEDCLRKPIDLGQLCATVEQWTRERKEGEPAAPGQRKSGAGRVVIKASAQLGGASTPAVMGLSDDGEGAPGQARPATASPEVGSGQPSLKLLASDVEPVGDGVWASSSAAAQRVREEETTAPLVPIDTSRLEESCMGIPALREALLQTFRADVGPRLTRLAEAIVAGDPRRVEFEAHGLKGMSATIGAVACEAAFDEIERLGRDEDVRTASRLLQIAQGTVERTEQFIDRLERILSQANEAA
jgi:CheY-like chemotaxis protein/HPt (histidine-containing phosphotransfer) domain-containing protein